MQIAKQLDLSILRITRKSGLSLLLDVPEAVARLGLSLNADNIKEGDDVYFECSIMANPRAYKVTWQHNVSILSVAGIGGVFLNRLEDR